MEKVKLAKALKIKNRLVGEINRLKSLMQRENVKREDLVRKVDVLAVANDLDGKEHELVLLKSKIATANIGIYEKIAYMEECKALIAFWNTFPSDARIDTKYNRNNEEIEVKSVPVIDRVMVDEIIVNLNKRIQDLQDEIDEYNAITYIEI